MAILLFTLIIKEAHIYSTLYPVNRVLKSQTRPLLLITEGVLDISCLTAFSQILHAVQPDVPDLQQLARRGDLIFLPAGGGDLSAWAARLAPLSCPEFLLCDREQQPETTLRRCLVERINNRQGCAAAMTTKRSLENYLHPAAIRETFGVTIEISDDTPVAELIAQADPKTSQPWSQLSRRSQHRLIYRVKRDLNLVTAQRMTDELLAESDPSGEILGWFHTIDRLRGRFSTTSSFSKEAIDAQCFTLPC